MTKQSVRLTNQEWRVLYCLMKRGGRSSFDKMMTESGMCLGMFMNHANELKMKGLIVEGKTFKEYIMTPKAKRLAREKLGFP